MLSVVKRKNKPMQWNRELRDRVEYFFEVKRSGMGEGTAGAKVLGQKRGWSVITGNRNHFDRSRVVQWEETEESGAKGRGQII